ncbi:MAG: hypothetical protein AAFS07_19140, partial [Pseudomonadota bacterium]
MTSPGRLDAAAWLPSPAGSVPTFGASPACQPFSDAELAAWLPPSVAAASGRRTPSLGAPSAPYDSSDPRTTSPASRGAPSVPYTAPEIDASPPHVTSDDVARLNDYFTVQRGVVASDAPAFETIPERPTAMTPNDVKCYFGSVEDIAIDPTLTDDQQRTLRELCAEYHDIFVRPDSI